MGLRGRLFAWSYERMMIASEAAGLADLRRDLLRRTRGDVLEIGAGTGLNLPHFGGEVRSLTLTEPEQPMVRRLERAVTASQFAPAVVQAPAEQLPFDDASFDTVVATLMLCTVMDQPRTLSEIRRVLRPGGELLFLEHVRAQDATTVRLQDRINGLNRFFGYGCNCNRDTVTAIGAAGFTLQGVTRGELPNAPRWIRPMAVGTATA